VGKLAFRLSGNHQPSHLPQQLRQLGDIGGDAPLSKFGAASAGLLVKLNIRQRLAL